VAAYVDGTASTAMSPFLSRWGRCPTRSCHWATRPLGPQSARADSPVAAPKGSVARGQTSGDGPLFLSLGRKPYRSRAHRSGAPVGAHQEKEGAPRLPAQGGLSACEDRFPKPAAASQAPISFDIPAAAA